MSNSEPKVKVKKRRRLKKGLFELAFILISICFILGCCIFYGSRLIKYYKIYNPKTTTGERVELIANTITKGANIVYEGDGLYRSSGSYIYKGSNVDNYIMFSNMLWRVVRTNADGSVKLVLDSDINVMRYDVDMVSYKLSDINKYLNDVFLSNLDTNMMIRTSVCTDVVTDINSITCNETYVDDYVTLLSITDFINSKSTKTYIIEDEDTIWFNNINDKEVWHSNGLNVSKSIPNSHYSVRPVITLKNSISLLGGTGTRKDPFIVEKKSSDPSIGDYVKLGNDLWIVYEEKNSVLRLVLDDLYNEGSFTYRFDLEDNNYNIDNTDSLAKYLNTTYYSKLSYNNYLLETEWYTGNYDISYKDVYKDKIKVKVGLYNVSDIKFGDKTTYYWLITPGDDNKVFMYDGINLTESKVSLSRAVRPTISINSKILKNGLGTFINPYKVGE